MNSVLNCPNCGAPVTGDKCEYCGTVIYDFAVMDDTKPTYIKIKMNGQILIFKAFLRNVEIRNHVDNIYYDNLSVMSCPQIDVTAEFSAVVGDDGYLCKLVKR